MAFNNFRSRQPRPRIKDNINEGIRAQQVRVIFPDGSNEVLPTSVAIQKAKALGLDLIVISPTAKPVVTKVIDEGKWAFEEKKRKHAAKQNQHVTLVKELKFSPNTDDHDYDFKRKHAVEWLGEGHKVKAVVRFKGREITHADLGRAILLRLAADVADFGKPEGSMRLEGKVGFILIGPVKRA